MEELYKMSKMRAIKMIKIRMTYLFQQMVIITI